MLIGDMILQLKSPSAILDNCNTFQMIAWPCQFLLSLYQITTYCMLCLKCQTGFSLLIDMLLLKGHLEVWDGLKMCLFLFVIDLKITI